MHIWWDEWNFELYEWKAGSAVRSRRVYVVSLSIKHEKKMKETQTVDVNVSIWNGFSKKRERTEKKR